MLEFRKKARHCIVNPAGRCRRGICRLGRVVVGIVVANPVRCDGSFAHT
jgi:hypothetical protein